MKIYNNTLFCMYMDSSIEKGLPPKDIKMFMDDMGHKLPKSIYNFLCYFLQEDKFLPTVQKLVDDLVENTSRRQLVWKKQVLKPLKYGSQER